MRSEKEPHRVLGALTELGAVLWENFLRSGNGKSSHVNRADSVRHYCDVFEVPD